MRPPARQLPATLAASAITLVAGLALACSSGGGTKQLTGTPPSTLPPGVTPSLSGTPVVSAEDALARYVQRTLSQGFVPDCAKEKRPDDVGKQCATFRRKRGDLLAYELGPTFSNPTRILILKPEAGDWTLQNIINVDPNQPSVPGIPWPLQVGAQVVVTGTTPDCLKIRAAPGIGSGQTDCIKDGAKGTVVAGPVDQDNIEWWQLKDLGWAAGDYLRYPEEAPTPLPTTR